MNNYLIIKVTGRNIYKFIFKCKNNNINLLSIKKINSNSLIIKIKYQDYNKLLKIKSIYNFEIINKKGLIKIYSYINNYKYLIIFSIFGLLFLIMLSNTIFKINIISDNNTLSKKIKKELEFYNIKKYSFMKTYDEIEIIKEKILKKYKNNIEWIEINRNGIKYDVQIVERKRRNNNIDLDATNIIARKPGVIKKIFVINGNKIVNENEYVNKGDIIISGLIKSNDEVKGLVKSNGSVYAETWYRVKIDYPLNYTEKIYTNNNKKSFFIKIGNRYFEKKNYKNYSRNNIISYKNRFIPFSIGINTQKEVKIINDRLSILEAKNKAISKAKNKIKKRLNDDEYIINQKTLNFYQKNSKIVLEEFFSCYENIGEEAKIE